jgi:hypothetical protein
MRLALPATSDLVGAPSCWRVVPTLGEIVWSAGVKMPQSQASAPNHRSSSPVAFTQADPGVCVLRGSPGDCFAKDLEIAEGYTAEP